MISVRFLIIFLCFFLATLTKGAPDLKRHAFLKHKKVNWRQGPSYEHPVLYTYTYAGWPVVVLKKCFHWYYVQDAQGIKGWVHTSGLSFKRHIFITKDMAALKTHYKPHAKVLAYLKKGVIGKLKKERKGWFYIEIKDHKGWVCEKDCWQPH